MGVWAGAGALSAAVAGEWVGVRADPEDWTLESERVWSLNSHHHWGHVICKGRRRFFRIKIHHHNVLDVECCKLNWLINNR